MSTLRRWRTPVVITVVLVAAVAVEVASGLSGSEKRRAAVALPAQVLVGPPVTPATLRGKPAIVHFWASWCQPCVEEAPEFAALRRRLGGRARLVGVNWSDNLGDAREFITRHRWTFPVLVDADAAAGQHDGIQGLPATLILDEQGRIVKRLTGPQTADGLLAQLPAR